MRFSSEAGSKRQIDKDASNVKGISAIRDSYLGGNEKTMKTIDDYIWKGNKQSFKEMVSSEKAVQLSKQR